MELKNTMSIQIKFFASLKENLNISDREIELQDLQTTKDVWLTVTNNKSIPENTLCAVNHQHVGLEYRVKDGDEIAFFPPVTGG